MYYDNLIGLQFKFGKQDCYTLVRQFYAQNFGLELRNYARPNDFWVYNMNLYMDNFHKEGFKAMDLRPEELRPGDALLMAVRSPTANHAAVVVEGGRILHHMIDRLSTVEDYKGPWRNRTLATLRHPGAVYVDPPSEAVSLLELLPDHVRARFTQDVSNARG